MRERVPAGRPARLSLSLTNKSDWCLNLIFFFFDDRFNLLIIFRLAGANDELSFSKFNLNPNFDNFDLVAKLMKTRLQNQKSNFLCIALNRVLTLGDYSTGDCVVVALKIIDFENKNISVVTKHWKYIISVPMLIITFLLWT